MNRVKKMSNIILKIEVNAQRMRLRSSRTPIVAGSTNLYLLDFEFSDVWDGASRYVQISDGQQTAEYQLLSEPLLLPASFYSQPGKITLTVWGTTSAQTLRVENAVLLEVVQACFTEGLTPQEPPEGLPEDVFVRSRNTPITADGSQADGKYISFLARDDAGTFYYYDADAQSYVPVRDAYRGAVESGYAGTESAFYTDLKNVHTFSLQAQQSAEEAARIEASIVYPEASVTQLENGAQITITDRNGTYFAQVFNGKKGDPGEKGDKGDKGEQGEKGDPGTSAWADITGKPTTVSGYGITDAVITADSDSANTAPTGVISFSAQASNVPVSNPQNGVMLSMQSKTSDKSAQMYLVGTGNSLGTDVYVRAQSAVLGTVAWGSWYKLLSAKDLAVESGTFNLQRDGAVMSNLCYYQRVGNIVLIWGKVPAGTASASATGLPFACAYYPAMGVGYQSMTLGQTSAPRYVGVSGTSIGVFDVSGTASGDECTFLVQYTIS